MAHTYKTEGIVLKRWPYKERDKMVRILTRDFGKITTRAISSRKLTSKLAGHLEPFVHADFFIAHSKTIDIVAGSNTITSHRTLRNSLEHNALANFFTEVVDKSIREEYADEALYIHVRELYTWLDANPAHLLAVYAAILQLFSLLGYTMELYECHQCKKPVKEVGNKFHYLLWNVECDDCASTDHTIPVSVATIKALRFLAEQPFSEATRLQLEEGEWHDVHTLLHSILRYHFDPPLKSADVVFAFLQ